MTFEQFQEELKKHDWHFGRSDCRKTYRKGKENEDRLTAIAHNNGWQTTMFAAKMKVM